MAAISTVTGNRIKMRLVDIDPTHVGAAFPSHPPKSDPIAPALRTATLSAGEALISGLVIVTLPLPSGQNG
jgi:hypothetical protein